MQDNPNFEQSLLKLAQRDLERATASLPLRFARFQQKAAMIGVEIRDKTIP